MTVSAKKWYPMPNQEFADSIMKMKMQTYPLPEKSHVSYVLYDDVGFDIEFIEYDGYKYYDLPKKDKTGKYIIRNKKYVTEPTLCHCFILHGIREKGVKYKHNDSELVSIGFILDDPINDMFFANLANLCPNTIGKNAPDGRFSTRIYFGDTWKQKKFPKQIRAIRLSGYSIDDPQRYASFAYFEHDFEVLTCTTEKKVFDSGNGSQSIVIDIPNDGYFYDRPNVTINNSYTLNHDSLPQNNSDTYIPPRYTGGADALEQFLDKNIEKSIYSSCLQNYQKFDVSLTVTKSGAVKDVTLTGSIETPLDKAIGEAFMKSEWIPGAIQLSYNKEDIDWTILIKDIQIFINWDEENIAKLASRPHLKPESLYAVITSTPLYTKPNKDSETIRIQDGLGGNLPYELDYGRVVKVLESHGDFVKIHWDGSMNYIKRNGLLETVNEGFIPNSCLTVPESLPEEWYYEEYESPNGYDISFEIGDGTITSSGATVELDQKHNIIVIGNMYTICYLNGEPQVRTRDIQEPQPNQ